jgi:hypothetical protein
VGAGFPDFHIIMIVDYGDVTPPGTGCGSPSNVAWLSATPKTGTINGIGTKNVTVKANAASLTAGTYGGLMCVNTNDAGASAVRDPGHVHGDTEHRQRHHLQEWIRWRAAGGSGRGDGHNQPAGAGGW